MNNKKLLFTLLAVLLVSIFAVVSVSAAEAENVSLDGLVTFDGYSVRTVNFNGLRSQYTLDTEKLAQLEKDYNIEIGILIGSFYSDDESSYKTLTVENNIYKSVFYSTDEGYVGKYYGNAEEDKKIEFVYAVTFASENAETKENYERNLSYRVYVAVTDFEDTTSVTYVDNVSEAFGYTLSLKDISARLTEDASTDLPILQRVLSVCNGSPLPKMDLLSRDLDRYSIVIEKETDLQVANEFNSEFKAATGYSLPIVYKGESVSSSALFDDAYIYVNTSAVLSSSSAYTVIAEEGYAEIKAENVSTAKKAAKAFVSALQKSNYTVIEVIKYIPDWSKPIK